MAKRVRKPTQVYLDADVHRKLRRRAVDEGVTMSELVRRAVDAYLVKGETNAKCR